MVDRHRVDLLVESSGGGAGKHALDLYFALGGRGHDVRLITSMGRSDDTFKSRIASLDRRAIIEIPMRRAPHVSDLTAIRSLLRLTRADRASRVLHAHSTKAGFIASVVRPWYGATIFTPHAYRGMDPTLKGVRSGLIRTAERLISVRHDAVIAVSREELDYARTLGIEPRRLVRVPNGVDVPAIRANAARARQAASPASPRETLTIGLAGRLTHQKNPMAFVDAFARVHRQRPAVRGLIIGDGDLLEAVREAVRARGLAEAVEVRGYAEIARHLHEIDLLVHTSHYESLPYVLIEACAAEVPVVSVRNAGSVEIFGADADLIDDPRDAEGIARACLRALSEPQELERLKDRSRRAADRYSLESMVGAIEGLYSAALRREGRGGLAAAG